MAFCQPCKAAFVHYRVCGATGESWCGVQLLTMFILAYPVGCKLNISVTYWRDSTTVGALMARRTHLQLAHSPPPPAPPPFTHPTWHVWYYRVVKNYLKNQLWVLHSRDSYWTLASYKTALHLQQDWHGYSVAQEKHIGFDISIQYFLKY